MRILADENFPGDAVEALQALGHDIIWIRTDSPGVPDAAILARAQKEQRTIVTFDKDFGELAFRQRLPASFGVVLFRLGGLPPVRVVDIVVRALTSQPDWSGRFAVVTEKRIRVVLVPK